MIKEIKKWGASNVLVITPEEMKYFDVSTGDYLNISDAIPIKKNGN